MVKVYEVWRESGIDYEGDSADILASYTNRKSAEEYLAWIEKKLREHIQLYDRGTIDEYVPGDHIYGDGFGGDYDRWSIVERDVQDEFVPTDLTLY